MDSEEGPPGHNITGVYERLGIPDAITIAKQIVPDLPGKKVAVLVDTSTTGKMIYNQIIKETNNFTMDTGVVFESFFIDSFTDMENAINHINANTDQYKLLYFVCLSIKDNRPGTNISANPPNLGISFTIPYVTSRSKVPGKFFF